MNKNTKLTLSNGTKIPIIGFGTFRVTDEAQVEDVITWALAAGYRHIDTAMIYKNEEAVGRAIAKSGIPREELFITTKLWNTDQGYESAITAMGASLDRLGLSYVDLYLIHWPTASDNLDESLNKREEAWKGMEVIYESGKAKAIGVSNYIINHLEEMKSYAKVMPMVNQFEFHPYLFQKDLLAYCKEHNILVEAHSPLAPAADPKSPGSDAIGEIAEKYGKSKAQLLVRWSLQHSVVPLPKSVHKERIEENIDVFDFEISEEDMDTLDAMNLNLHVRRDPTNLK